MSAPAASPLHGPDEFWPIVCATGPRPQHTTPEMRAWIRPKLYDAACWLRDHRGTTVGISGMAIGVDTWWAEAVLRAGLILGAHIPCPEQFDPWTARDQATWHRLMASRDERYSHTYAQEYSPKAPHIRNHGMLAASSAVLCVWCPSRTSGGTWGAVQLAVGKRRRSVHLDPCRQQVRLGLPDISGSSAWPHHCTPTSQPRAARGSAPARKAATASNRVKAAATS